MSKQSATETMIDGPPPPVASQAPYRPPAADVTPPAIRPARENRPSPASVRIPFDARYILRFALAVMAVSLFTPWIFNVGRSGSAVYNSGFGIWGYESAANDFWGIILLVATIATVVVGSLALTRGKSNLFKATAILGGVIVVAGVIFRTQIPSATDVLGAAGGAATGGFAAVWGLYLLIVAGAVVVAGALGHIFDAHVTIERKPVQAAIPAFAATPQPGVHTPGYGPDATVTSPGAASAQPFRSPPPAGAARNYRP